MHIINHFIDGGVLDFNRLVFDLNINIGWGYINTQTKGNLTLYNYTKSCNFARAWNPATRIARGLVLDLVAKKVVVTPLEKFFNYGGEHDEHGRDIEGSSIVSYSEKMDGSCVFIFWNSYDEEWQTCTRGSFYSDQAISAQSLLSGLNLDKLQIGLTYICEVILPYNKIVVDYGDEEFLCLLEVNDSLGNNIDNDTLDHIGAEVGFKRPQIFGFESPQSAYKHVKGLPKQQEGIVVLYDNGVRVKMKGDEYCHFHGLLANHTPLFMWRTFVSGGSELIKANKKDVPEELWEEYDEWGGIFERNIEFINTKVNKYVKEFSHLSDRELGQFLTRTKNKYSHFIFARRKRGEDYFLEPKIFENMCRWFRPESNKIIDLTIPTTIV